MTALLVALIFVCSALSFALGVVWRTTRTDRLLAAMTPTELASLAARVARHRT